MILWALTSRISKVPWAHMGENKAGTLKTKEATCAKAWEYEMPGVIRRQNEPRTLPPSLPYRARPGIWKEIPTSCPLSPLQLICPSFLYSGPIFVPSVSRAKQKAAPPQREGPAECSQAHHHLSFLYSFHSLVLALCALCLMGGRVGRKTEAACGPFCYKVNNYFISTQFPVHVYLLLFPLFNLIGISRIAPCSSLLIFCCKRVTRSLPRGCRVRR